MNTHIVGLSLTEIVMLAVNIHRMGMEQPLEPVEVRSPHHIPVMQVLSVIAGKPRTDERGVVHSFHTS